MKTLKLTFKASSDNMPDRILVKNSESNVVIACVFCDGVINPLKGSFYYEEMKQIMAIADSFGLFAKNIVEEK